MTLIGVLCELAGLPAVRLDHVASLGALPVRLGVPLLTAIFALELGRIFAAVDANTATWVPMVLTTCVVGLGFMLGRLSGRS